MKQAMENRSVPLPVRFSETECEMLKRAADLEHEYVSSYIRRVSMIETERRLAEADKMS